MQRSCTRGRDCENESRVRPVQKKQAVIRHKHAFSNLRRGKFSLDDYEADYDALHCVCAEVDGESASTLD